MKKKLPLIIIVLLFIGGLILILYPTIGDVVNKMTSSVAISGYKDDVLKLDDETLEKKFEAAQKYNRILSSCDGGNFGGENDFTKLEEYAEYFSVDQILGFISIPAIDVYLPIYTGAADDVLDKGVWLMDNTSIPIGGESTNSGLSGHRGLPSATLFSNLDQMEKGDMFYIYVLDRTLAYRVSEIKVVEPTEAETMDIIKGEDHVTLVTCTPYGVNTHRLLVIGDRTEYIENTDKHNSLLEDNVHLIPWIVLGGVVILIILPVIIIVMRRKRRNRRTHIEF